MRNVLIEILVQMGLCSRSISHMDLRSAIFGLFEVMMSHREQYVLRLPRNVLALQDPRKMERGRKREGVTITKLILIPE